MMKKLILSTLTMLFCFSMNSYAIECPAGGVVIYEFHHLDTTHEQFNCALGKNIPAGKQVIFYNHAEMSSGFDVRGTLRADSTELNQYYFDNFHDTDKKYEGERGYVCAISDFPISCNQGAGGLADRFIGTYG